MLIKQKLTWCERFSLKFTKKTAELIHWCHPNVSIANSEEISSSILIYFLLTFNKSLFAGKSVASMTFLPNIMRSQVDTPKVFSSSFTLPLGTDFLQDILNKMLLETPLVAALLKVTLLHGCLSRFFLWCKVAQSVVGIKEVLTSI